jgi:hypothetical protein
MPPHRDYRHLDGCDKDFVDRKELRANTPAAGTRKNFRVRPSYYSGKQKIGDRSSVS